MTDAASLVEATERLYRSLFTAAIGLALGTALWGMVITPFNGYNDHQLLSLGLGVLLVAPYGVAIARRQQMFRLLRRYPAGLLVVVILSVSVLWLDGGWRSSYYLASYAAIALAAVVAGLRWASACALLLAAGYAAGLAMNGYSWAELQTLKDADSVVANAGGYLIAGYFFAAPVGWLGGYVARINQVIEVDSGGHEDDETSDSKRDGLVTDSLTAREIEVVQLIAGGATNEEIAARLVISARTVDSHVKNAMRKTTARNRTDLAVIAVGDGLVPDRSPVSA